MTTLSGTRFGDIDVSEERAMTFPRGLIGFPASQRYVLLEPAPGRSVAWLQSLDVPELAFPVVNGAAVVADGAYPEGGALATAAGLHADEVAVLIVIAPRRHGGVVANLLAPLVVDLATRRGAQVVLDHRRYSAQARIALSA